MFKKLLDEINERAAKMQTEAPEDLNRLRTRMGARNQNAAIAIYGYVDTGSTSCLLWQLEQNSLKEDYEFETLKKITADWLRFLVDRMPRYYHFEDTTRLTGEAADAILNCTAREDVHSIIKAIQHYYCQLYFWIDLTIPWNSIGIAYAKALGDPVNQ